MFGRVAIIMRDCTRIIIMSERIVMSDKILVIVSKGLLRQKDTFIWKMLWQTAVDQKLCDSYQYHY